MRCTARFRMVSSIHMRRGGFRRHDVAMPVPSSPSILGVDVQVSVGEADPELLALTLFTQLICTVLVVAFWCDWRWSWERAQELRRAARRAGR